MTYHSTGQLFRSLSQGHNVQVTVLIRTLRGLLNTASPCWEPLLRAVVALTDLVPAVGKSFWSCCMDMTVTLAGTLGTFWWRCFPPHNYWCNHKDPARILTLEHIPLVLTTTVFLRDRGTSGDSRGLFKDTLKSYMDQGSLLNDLRATAFKEEKEPYLEWNVTLVLGAAALLQLQGKLFSS